VTVPLAMSVTYISFSAHTDFLQTSEYIDTLQPPYIVLVHGDANEMGRLKDSLVRKYDSQNVSVLCPRNGQIVTLEFRSDKVAKTVGTLAADTADHQSTTLKGLVVIKGNFFFPSPKYTHSQRVCCLPSAPSNADCFSSKT
jgi:cleavage and polyadenylation specificity factor subunit 3